jgi:hypothetical protein
MAAGKKNRKQRKELARQLQSANPGLEVVHPRAITRMKGNERLSPKKRGRRLHSNRLNTRRLFSSELLLIGRRHFILITPRSEALINAAPVSALRSGLLIRRRVPISPTQANRSSGIDQFQSQTNVANG